MTARQIWQNIMYYGDFDRMPVVHWHGWDETRQRWIEEGLPVDVDEHEYFNAVRQWYKLGANIHPFPPFKEETIEETEEYRVFRDEMGVIQKDWKHKSSIPHYIDFTLKQAKDWDEYKKRLQPDSRRIPDDIDEYIARAEASGIAIGFWCGSLMGYIRNWMGLENMAFLMYDSRDTYADMVDTLAELTCWSIDQIIPKMNTVPDMGHCWEDICGKNGPMISPDVFRECVAPGYIKIRNKLEEYGIKLLSIDSDGDISQLIEPWLDAGVNVQFPIEIGTWNADPMAFREKYGKELRIIGGLNKLELEKGPAAIDAEIERRLPLMKDGGYIVMPDHLITPGVSLDNYRYYLDRIRALRF